MKEDEIAIIADFLWKRELDFFTTRVFDALDEYFRYIIIKDQEIDSNLGFITVRTRLQQDPAERPYFDQIYNETFDYYMKYLLPDLVEEGTKAIRSGKH